MILARVKVTICGTVQVGRQQKESTCSGRKQVFVTGLFNSCVPKTARKYEKQYSRESTRGVQKQKQKNEAKPAETALSC